MVSNERPLAQAVFRCVEAVFAANLTRAVLGTGVHTSGESGYLWSQARADTSKTLGTVKCLLWWTGHGRTVS